MKTETVNNELWKAYYSDLLDIHYIKEGKQTIIHLVNDSDYSNDESDKKLNELSELIVTAVNSCKEINKDNPLNVAKAIPELFEACIKSLKVFKQLADAGHYPFPLMADNGGEGLKFLCDAIEKATEQ